MASIEIDTCLCGSGKPATSCCPQMRRDKIAYIDVDVAPGHEVVDLLPDLGHARLRSGLLVPIEAVRYRFVRPRASPSKPEKTLSEVPASPKSLRRVLRFGMDEYDAFIAVDTNGRDTPAGKVCVVAIHAFAPAEIVKNSGNYLYPRGESVYGFWEPAGNPERVGWLAALHALRNSGVTDRYSRIGMIVDSELGLIRNINARTEPVEDGEFLPPEFTLLYASSDGPRLHAPCSMIKDADRTAKRELRELLQRSPKPPQPSIDYGMFRDLWIIRQ